VVRELFLQFSRESFIYGLTSAAAKLVGFILVPIYARALSPSSLGILYLLSSGTAILSSTLILGMDASIAITFYETEDTTKRRTIASTFLIFEVVFTIITCGLIFMMAAPVSSVVFGDPSLTPYLQLAVAIVPFAIYVTMFLDISRLVRAPLRYMVISIGNLLLTSLLIILAVVVLKKGVEGVLAATLIGSATFSLLGLYLTRSQYAVLFSRHALRRMLLLGLPLVPASLALWVINSSNRWFVLGLTSSTDEVAILTIATSLAAPVALVVTAFQIAWVPFSLSISRNEVAERVYARTLLYFVALTFAILLPLTLWAGPIIVIFATPTYLPAAQLIAPIGLGVICSGVYYIVATGLNLAAKTIHIGWTMIVAAGVSIALNIVLIPVFGLIGAAFAGFIANLTPVVLLYFLAQRIHPIPYELHRVLALSGAGVTMLLAASLIDISDPLLDFLVRVSFLVVFACVLVALGIVRTRELREIWRLLSQRMRRGADA